MGADLRRPPESDLIAIGGTSEVYRMGADLAAKILRVEVPSAWAQLEASFTESVRRLGVPAPEVREVATVEGRPAILFRLVDGPSMWARMRAGPSLIPELVGVLVDIQRAIHTSGVPEDLPSLVTRMRQKVEASTQLGAADRNEADDLLRALPSGCALLHGDLHPGNILFGDEGPVVVDWFDVTVGHPVADLARTALLVRPAGDRPETSPGREFVGGGGDRALLSRADRLDRLGRLRFVDAVGCCESVGRANRRRFRRVAPDLA